jgi:hypothetical protein
VKKESMFFSEEGGSPPGKNQKTFMSAPVHPYPAKSRIPPLAQNQKSFGSFLQKRTPFL